MLITVKGLKVFQGGAILEKVPLVGRVLGLYCKFSTNFFPIGFMAQWQSVQAINQHEKKKKQESLIYSTG